MTSNAGLPASHPPPRGCFSLTLGVEEEFQLVHEDTGQPAPYADAVLAHAAKLPPPGDGSTLHGELLTSMVESATGICTSLAQVRRQLTGARSRLAQAAREEGVRLLALGVRPSPAAPRHVSPTQHYESMHQMYGHLVAETETCGCHVHVGTLDKDQAVTSNNHLRPWLPTLLALSANSAFHNGIATGYASWRTIALSRWPTTQMPPHFTSVDHYEETFAALHRGGVLPAGSNAYWLARPSRRLPTVEIRVADVSPTVDGAVLQAGLSRALVHTALNDPTPHQHRSRHDDQLLAAALWTAARHGIRGPALHPHSGHQTLAADLAQELLIALRPALRETGDWEEIEHLLADALRRGGRQAGSHTGAVLTEEPKRGRKLALEP
ncbi:glutamate--cysteine ligase [Streptomyces sp. MS1.AVA.3]|uniref:carboxylate-amine ligase n=1 Tax=Streptomyces decoyicus TaxID=249567 RepID=UPI0030C3115E